ncbi:hypothetical protein HID58_067499, partial [Brassica napus]
TKISNLPMELLEEILSRVPVKSIVTVRSTCKNWNVLTEDQRLANKHIEKAAAASQREKERSFYIVPFIATTLGEFEIAVWEEKKTVEAFDDFNNWYNTYIIDGESGHSREVDSTKSSHPRLYNIVSNYVPSSVQI